MTSEIRNNNKKPNKGKHNSGSKDNNSINEVDRKDIHILRKVSPKFRLWLELTDATLPEDEKSILGKGRAKLLQKIAETGSISDAIRDVPPKHSARRSTGPSYRYAWGLLKDITKRIGKPIVQKFRGGRKGGGTELTETGQELLKYYESLENFIQTALSDAELWESIAFKISDKNRLKGKVVSIMRDNIAAKVKIELKVPTIIDSLITAEAARDLDINKEDIVKAVIKATEIYLAKEES